ncbi:MAG: response regulator transcription factor [Pasteurellaceae bacterium]|nr:response regulator transcription factor [Pasteurellaceae bacterium]
MKKTILIVDDDVQICTLLSDIFEEHQYNVLSVHCGRDALALLATPNVVDLILLDLILPDTNGLLLLQQLKQMTPVPILLLSGLGSESDVVVGLEMGADDYIAKPFYPRVVVARVKAALRRLAPPAVMMPARSGLRFESWFLDTENHRLFNAQQQNVELTQGEYVLLYALASHPQKVLSRQKLLELTHSETLEIFDRTIDVLIMRLRKKMEPNPKSPTFIQTIRSVGYMFACAVEQVG